MDKKNFAIIESHIIKIFRRGKTFIYRGEKYKIINSGKPRPDGVNGECKTDLYILAEKNNGSLKEFKISIKKSNADFVENKVKLKRAIEIFGENAQSIIKKSTQILKKDLKDNNLIYFKKSGQTKEHSITLGWRLDFVNKSNSKKCTKISLTDSQKIDIYAGTNLCVEKKNSKVNDEIIENSGIANFIINLNESIDDRNNINYYISKILPIEEFAKKQEIYFACRAVNLRYEGNGEIEWESNRDLVVYIKWRLDINNTLKYRLTFNEPLYITSNIVGENLKRLLSQLNINKNNFSDLKNSLDNRIKYLI